MITLANKPVTKEDYLKRALAIILDEAFIRGSRPGHELPHTFILNTHVAKDFDQLVDKLSKAVYRQLDKPDGV